MEAQIVELKPLKLVGLKTSIRKSRDQADDLSAVPQLWRKLMSILAHLPNRVGEERYALITGDLPIAKQDDATYYAFVAVSSFEHIPESLVMMTLQQQKTVKFRHQGLPQDIYKTARYAFYDWLPHSKESISKNAEMFVYPAGYKINDPMGVFDYYLFLK